MVRCSDGPIIRLVEPKGPGLNFLNLPQYQMEWASPSGLDSRPVGRRECLGQVSLFQARNFPIMNAEELRSTQAPLKERYRAAPETARITLRAQGRLGEGISCKVETGRALVVAGLHPVTGGSGSGACSGDMLLEALVACAGVTLAAVATALGIELRDALLQAEGDLDFRGTLGVSKETPVGFQNIRLRFTLETDASEEQLTTLLRLTERYCVVYQTLAHPPTMTVDRQSIPTQKT